MEVPGNEYVTHSLGYTVALSAITLRSRVRRVFKRRASSNDRSLSCLSIKVRDSKCPPRPLPVCIPSLIGRIRLKNDVREGPLETNEACLLWRAAAPRNLVKSSNPPFPPKKHERWRTHHGRRRAE